MKRNISEDLPERKFAPAAAGGSAPADKKENSTMNSEEKVSQAASDIRYKAKLKDIPVMQEYTEYMQNSTLSTQEQNMVKEKLFGKQGFGIKAEDYNAMFSNAASDSISSALYKVFVERKTQNEDPIQLTYFEELQNSKERKYEIKVTNEYGTYVRFATREKINKLRANPKIKEVEIISVDPTKMTAYGAPYEGERTKGDRTAAAMAGKDYDGDGKVESGAKEYRGSVHNAIQRKKGGTPDGRDTSSVKEDFIHEAGKKKVDDVEKTFDVMKGKNTVKVCSENDNAISESGYSKFLKKVNTVKEEAVSQNQQQLAGMALAFLRGDMPDASEEVKKMAKMGEKELRKFAKTKHEGLPEKVKEEAECNSDDSKEEEDPRSMKTKINLVKNKLRAMGLKMSYEPEGDQIDEFFGPQTTTPKNSPTGTKSVEVDKPYPARQNNQPVDVKYSKDGNKKVTPMSPARQGMMNYTQGSTWGLKMSYEPEGDQISEGDVPPEYKNDRLGWYAKLSQMRSDALNTPAAKKAWEKSPSNANNRESPYYDAGTRTLKRKRRGN